MDRQLIDPIKASIYLLSYSTLKIFQLYPYFLIGAFKDLKYNQTKLETFKL